VRALPACVAASFALTSAGCSERWVAYELAAGLREQPYEVPPGEHVACFDVTAAVPRGPVAAIVPRLAPGLAHHVALHRAARAPVDHACATMGASTLLYMGSPGDDALVAPGGHALSLADDREGVFVLEVHYVSARDAVQTDTSGVTVMVGEGRDRDPIGPWIVGDVLLDIPARAVAHEEGRSCTIRSEVPVTLHAVSPHMHARGVALSVTREHGGVLETLVEVAPFDPNRQRTITLDAPVTLAPGDRIHLRCVYDNLTDEAVRYGVHLEDEMCFAYFWASPIDALHADAPFCH
jgi:hypothetical protein